MLLAGVPPSDVAAHCGFVDQSHMTRHFKRIVGVTPSRYVRSKTHAGLSDTAERIVNYAASLVQRGDRRGP